MFKKVLIISDNDFLCRKFYEIIREGNYESTNFTFAISPFSVIEDFYVSKETDLFVYNLKLPDDVNFIIKNFDLVFSIHCKQIFPAHLVNGVKCINIHPGYNPITRGWYPQVFAIIYDLPAGATIHEIDTKLDHGKIIARGIVEKEIFDTSETLYKKILEMEIALLGQHLGPIINNTYKTIVPETDGNLFLKKDFKNLLQLELQEQITVADFIKRLRALTHGNFKNAFFIDPETKKKIYVGLTLQIEDDE